MLCVCESVCGWVFVLCVCVRACVCVCGGTSFPLYMHD